MAGNTKSFIWRLSAFRQVLQAQPIEGNKTEGAPIPSRKGFCSAGVFNQRKLSEELRR